MRLTRREFLATSAALAAGAAVSGFASHSPPRRFEGGILGAGARVGHLLRDGGIPPPSSTERTGVVIVGGGIGGLAAGRALRRRGFDDFRVLELEEKPGGNSMSGRNSVSAYPWGAHYVPLANPENRDILELFEELDIITGHDASGLPIYNEYHLCADPHERLYIHGRWQEGLVPQVGITDRDRAQYDQFFPAMEKFRNARGRDGRPAFAIPVDASSRDPEWVRLDAISMEKFLDERGWDSKPLRWYVNYCCRDDYGATMRDTSAWAGIHYFASRRGRAANAGSQTVVTWPEGNGWIVKRFRDAIGDRVRTSCLAVNIERDESGVAVDYYDVAQNRTVRVRARAVIFAAPRFVASRVIRELRGAADAATGFSYSPWAVANLTLRSRPEGRGADLSWDNVMYTSDSLGYVVANHQRLESRPRETVITWYQPLSDKSPREARMEAISTSYDTWTERIVHDLKRAHPGIADEITHLDVWLWGHGMIRPTPGFIWGKARQAAMKPLGNIFFAHSDLSGISIFEEAYTRGIQAAAQTLKHLRWKK